MSPNLAIYISDELGNFARCRMRESCGLKTLAAVHPVCVRLRKEATQNRELFRLVRECLLCQVELDPFLRRDLRAFMATPLLPCYNHFYHLVLAYFVHGAHEPCQSGIYNADA